MKRFVVIAAALLAVLTGAQADTSYLLIQGPFGAAGAEETFQWQVNYAPGALITGQDLLFSILGTPALTGTYTDAYQSNWPEWVSGNATQGATYIDFADYTKPNATPALFAISFTLASTTVTMDSSYSPGWNYYVAGGGGAHAYANSGTWTYSDDGQRTRTLSDGSFDAWTSGPTYPAAAVDGAGNTPTTANFAGATAASVPEPGGVALLVIGAGAMVTQIKRRH